MRLFRRFLRAALFTEVHGRVFSEVGRDLNQITRPGLDTPAFAWSLWLWRAPVNGSFGLFWRPLAEDHPLAGV